MAFKKIIAGLVVTAGASLIYAAPAAAQATRTWVSGVGDDVNPCSRTAPCKTFAGTISKTATGGEINCLDPGAWGSVTITKSITIDCSQFPGGILNASVPGITINAAATDRVVIRGLELNGGSLVSPGTFGIRFFNGASLIVENVVIRGNSVSGGTGILFAPSGAAKLHLSNVTVSNNGNGATGGGIDIAPQAGGSAKVVLTNTRVVDNSNFGFRADTTSTTAAAGITVTADGSVFSGNTIGFVLKAPAATTTATAMVSNSTISENTNQAILASGSSTLRVGNTDITNNGTALAFGGGALVYSYGDNRLNGNTNETTGFTSIIPTK